MPMLHMLLISCDLIDNMNDAGEGSKVENEDSQSRPDSWEQ